MISYILKTFALLGLLLLSPFLIIAMVLILIEDGLPVIFIQKRLGKDKRAFNFYKLRTMKKNVPNKGTHEVSQLNYLKCGHFLRKYKIDELPQLINVLLGHMSLVGPRPELPFYTSQYSKEEEKILSVRPGITDFASIEFYNLSSLVPDQNSNDFFESQILTKKNQLRLKYINEMSLLTDCKIFFLTIIKIFKLLLKK